MDSANFYFTHFHPCREQEVHLDTVEIDPDLDQDTHLADIPN
jgi:hypothetical protein